MNFLWLQATFFPCAWVSCQRLNISKTQLELSSVFFTSSTADMCGWGELCQQAALQLELSVYKHTAYLTTLSIPNTRHQNCTSKVKYGRKHHLQASFHKASQTAVHSRNDPSLNCNQGVLFSYIFPFFVVHLLKNTFLNRIALEIIKDWLTMGMKV